MKKAISKKLSVTKRKISNEWAKYRKTKSSLLKRKKLSLSEKKQVLQSEIDLTRQRISDDWSNYREKKVAILHQSPYRGFHYYKKVSGSMYKPTGYEKKEYFKFHDTYQKIYKANKSFNPEDLYKLVPEILSQKDVKGILLVFSIHNIDEDTDQVVSNYVNAPLNELIQEKGETIYEYVLARFQGYGNYKLRFIYLRIIYAKK